MSDSKQIPTFSGNPDEFAHMYKVSAFRKNNNRSNLQIVVNTFTRVKNFICAKYSQHVGLAKLSSPQNKEHVNG